MRKATIHSHHTADEAFVLRQRPFEQAADLPDAHLPAHYSHLAAAVLALLARHMPFICPALDTGEHPPAYVGTLEIVCPQPEATIFLELKTDRATLATDDLHIMMGITSNMEATAFTRLLPCTAPLLVAVAHHPVFIPLVTFNLAAHRQVHQDAIETLQQGLKEQLQRPIRQLPDMGPPTQGKRP